MGIGAITPTAFGAVTNPTPFNLVLPAAVSKVARDHGLLSVIGTPRSRGSIIANGMDPVRSIHEDAVYRLGLLAPKSAITATPTGVRATATLDIDVTGGGASPYTIANGDQIYVGMLITFKTTLTTNPFWYEVKIGGTPSATLDNLRALFDQSGTPGVTYAYPNWISYLPVWSVIEVTAKDATTVSFRVKRYGVNGNGFAAYLKSGTWTDSSLGSTGGTVGSPGLFQSGADGTGTAPSAGSYLYLQQFFRKADGALSGASPYVEAQIDESMNIDLASIAAPLSDDDIDYKRWLRTKGGGNLYYHGKDIAEADTTDTDDLDNDTLATHARYDSTIYRLFAGGFIERVKHLVEFNGAWVGAGFVRGTDYTAGTCAVLGPDNSAGASNVVTITGGHPTKELEHWTFQTEQDSEDDALEAEIIYVDEDNLQIHLANDWLGGTGSSLSYRIRDTRDPFKVIYSEPGLPHNAPTAYQQDGVQSPDPEGITGMYAAFEAVVIFTKTGIWLMTGQNRPYRLTHAYEGVGCVAGHSIVLVDQTLFWLGRDGIYAWAGDGEPTKVSSPDGEPRGIARTIARINKNAVGDAVAHYDEDRRIVRWFVPLDSDITNRNAIVLDLATRAWSLDVAHDVTTCRTVTDANGVRRVLAGDIHGHVWEMDVSTSDGAFGFEPVQTITTGGTLRTIPVTGTPYTANGMLGVPGYIVDASGNFSKVRVSTNTNSVVTTTTEMDAAPTAGGYLIMGGIHYRIESGWFTYDDPALIKVLEAVKALFAYQSQGQYWMSYAVDQGSTTVLSATGGDLSATDGEEHHWVGNEGRRLKIRIDAIGPGFDVAMQRLQMWVLVGEEVEGA